MTAWRGCETVRAHGASACTRAVRASIHCTRLVEGRPARRCRSARPLQLHPSARPPVRPSVRPSVCPSASVRVRPVRPHPSASVRVRPVRPHPSASVRVRPP
eukprot:4461239-Prymnesium_polylepis.2